MKLICHVVLVLLICISTVACAKSFDKKIFIDQVYSSSLGMTEESSVDRTQVLYKLLNNSTFTPTISVDNYYPSAYTYRLLFLLDYSQVRVKYNGHEVEYIDLNLNPNESTEIIIEVPTIQSGRHDFVVTAIRDPDNTLENEQLVYPDQVYLSRRSTIIVNEDSIPNIRYTEVVATNIENKTPVPFINSSSTDTNYSSLESLIFAKDVKELYLNMSTEEDNETMALIIFSGKEQLILEDKFFLIPKAGQYKIKMSELELEKINNKNLIIAIAKNPFNKDASQNMDGVNFSNLITIK